MNEKREKKKKHDRSTGPRGYYCTHALWGESEERKKKCVFRRCEKYTVPPPPPRAPTHPPGTRRPYTMSSANRGGVFSGRRTRNVFAPWRERVPSASSPRGPPGTVTVRWSSGWQVGAARPAPTIRLPPSARGRRPIVARRHRRPRPPEQLPFTPAQQIIVCFHTHRRAGPLHTVMRGITYPALPPRPYPLYPPDPFSFYTYDYHLFFLFLLPPPPSPRPPDHLNNMAVIVFSAAQGRRPSHARTITIIIYYIAVTLDNNIHEYNKYNKRTVHNITRTYARHCYRRNGVWPEPRGVLIVRYDEIGTPHARAPPFCCSYASKTALTTITARYTTPLLCGNVRNDRHGWPVTVSRNDAKSAIHNPGCQGNREIY